MKHKNDLIFNNKINGKPKFGFRKLTVGLAAVTLGTAFFLENGQLVQADTQNNPESVSQVKTKAKSQHPKADEVSNPASADFNKQTDTTLKSNDKAPATNNTLKASITDSTLNDNDKETSLDVKKSNHPYSAFFERKTVANETIKVTANKTDKDGNNTTPIDKQKNVSLMAGQDTVNVTIKVTNPKLDNNNSLTINLPNAGKNKDFKIPDQKQTISDKDDKQSTWTIIPSEDEQNGSSIVAKWSSPTMRQPQDLKITLPVQGNSDFIKRDTNDQKFTIKVNGTSYTAFTADLKPYQEKVSKGEILKGFPMGVNTFNNVNGSYAEKSNFSTADIEKFKLNKNSKILQWGIYFNYGSQKNNTNLYSLINATFGTSFSHGQILIPSSIKVFEVPTGMAVDNNGYRHGVADYYHDPQDQTQNSTYYNQIATGQNQKPEFENLLKTNLTYVDPTTKKDPNGFKVSQKGAFKIKGNDNYGKHAYFIQLDTFLGNATAVPGDGTTITYTHTLNGTGEQIDRQTTSWTNKISGESDSNTDQKNKLITYQINHVYKNGSKLSNKPFDSTTATIKFLSEDNGKTWTKYSENNGKTWRDITNNSIFIKLVASRHAAKKYVANLNKSIITKNDQRFNLNSDNNQLVINPASAKDKDKYVITIPYYAPEAAHVTFYDDTDNKPLDTYLNQHSQKTQIDDNYQKQDNSSTQQDISFKDADSVVNFLTSKHYIFSRITGQGSTTNKNYYQISYGKFDNNESVDQVFVLHFVHDIKSERQTANVKEHVSYYYENGPKQGQEVPANYRTLDYELNFVRTKTTDLVTGKSTESNWILDSAKNNSNIALAFKAIPFNKLPQNLDDHYQLNPDGKFIITDTSGKYETEDLLIVKGKDGKIQLITFNNNEISALPANAKIDIQVPYDVTSPSPTPQPNPNPAKPQPSKPIQSVNPTKPVNPTQPAQPTEPTQPTGHKTSTRHPKQVTKKTGRQSHNWGKNNNPRSENSNYHKHNENRQDYRHNNVPKGNSFNNTQPNKETNLSNTNIKGKKQNYNILPQTGENKSKLGILGLSLTALGCLISLAVDRKKHKN